MLEKILLTSREIERALARIAHEIVEKNKGAEDVVLVGMRTRGVPLAKRIAEIIEAFEESQFLWAPWTLAFIAMIFHLQN